eukprot:3580085-Pyramimonas_sp.AAC.2
MSDDVRENLLVVSPGKETQGCTFLRTETGSLLLHPHSTLRGRIDVLVWLTCAFSLFSGPFFYAFVEETSTELAIVLL